MDLGISYDLLILAVGYRLGSGLDLHVLILKLRLKGQTLLGVPHS